MQPVSKQKICELTSVLSTQWQILYENAFAPNRREALATIAKMLSCGRLLLHETRDKNGELLCFSMTIMAPDFCVLDYLAVDPQLRSGGYGSKHMKELVSFLKQNYPSIKCILLEIDARKPRFSSISGSEKRIRRRRWQFYKRLGASNFTAGFSIRVPSRDKSFDLESDLLMIPLATDTMSSVLASTKSKQDLLIKFYDKSENLPYDHILVQEALSELEEQDLKEKT